MGIRFLLVGIIFLGSLNVRADAMDEAIFFLTTPDPLEYQDYERGNIFVVTLKKELRKDILYTILLHFKSQFNLDILRTSSYARSGASTPEQNIIIRYNGSREDLAHDISRLLDIKEILSISTVVNFKSIQEPERWEPIEYSDKVVPFRRVNKQKSDLSGLVVFKPMSDFSKSPFTGEPTVTITHRAKPYLYVVKTNPICYSLFR